MHEGDSAVLWDSGLKPQKYGKIGRVPPCLRREPHKVAYTKPHLIGGNQVVLVLGALVERGGGSGLKVGVNLLFFPCTLLGAH